MALSVVRVGKSGGISYPWGKRLCRSGTIKSADARGAIYANGRFKFIKATLKKFKYCQFEYFQTIKVVFSIDQQWLLFHL